jgi:CHRD domain-containing protein
MVLFNNKLCGIILFGIISSIIFATTMSNNHVDAAQAKQQFKAKLKGDNEVPAVTTQAEGKASLKVKEPNIKYKLNITGLADITMAHIHQGKSGENGEPVVDLLAAGNKQKTSKGLFINGSITDSSLIGPMKGKTVSDLVSSISAGNNYVNVHTQAHPDGEIRGQLKVSGQTNATSAIQNSTGAETDTQAGSAIVTPTVQ